MKLNKRIISVIFLIAAMVLLITAINYNNMQDKKIAMEALENNIEKQAIINYILKNINQIMMPDYLNENMPETVSCNDVNNNVNVLEYMKDGMENSAITDYYQEDINDVMTISHSKQIAIRYYETDLNDDGMEDLIVLIMSPLHSGSHGDEFDILFNDGTSYLKNRMGYTFRLLSGTSNNYAPFGEIYVLQSKTNGYHDLEIFTEETHFFLKYQNGAYQYVSID